MKLIVAISGASGAHLGIKLANTTASLNINTSLIITQNAKLSMQKESLSIEIILAQLQLVVQLCMML